MQNTEETIAKYAVGANLFGLGFTNPKKNIQPLDFFLVGGEDAHEVPSKMLRYNLIRRI